MIENNLIQSNFLGRDGFKWWIGQIAPEEVQASQIDGGGWGNRFKVRILGYHPDDEIELKNEELPWAQVLVSPEAGSGAAGRSKPTRISPGDNVLGFFLDGDNAQQPVILGVFPKTSVNKELTKNKQYSEPFAPYTGYTSKVKPNDNIQQNEAGDQNSSSSPTNRQVDTKTAKKIEEMTGEVTRVASSVIGTTITAGDTGGARSAVNKISSKLENTMKDFQGATSQQKFKILSEASKDIAASATSMSSAMVTSTFDGMAPKLNEGLHKLYKSEYSRVLEETLDPALAKKAAQAAQIAKVPSIKGIESFIPCAMKNVTDKLEGNIANLLAPFLSNVSNFTPCIADQFTSGILNSIIGSINDALAPLMGDLGDIFPGDIASMLREKADGLFGIAQVVECDLPTAASELGSKTNQWTVGKGPKNVSMPISGLANKLLGVANAAESLAEAAAAPGGIAGNLLSGVSIPGLGAFDFMGTASNEPGFKSALGACYTGPPLDCSGIEIKIFGGGGEGATGQAIIGALVGDAFAEQTGSLLGVKMTNGGNNYSSTPFVDIVDTCQQGYGAVAKAVIDYDPSSPTYQQVTDIYVVSGGENYPVVETDNETYTVDHVVVVNPGENYKNEDVITDEQGNVYDKILDENGRIINVIPPNPEVNNVKEVTELPVLTVQSQTGFGAILTGQITPRPSYQGEIKQVIDCISPRDGIVGFVNGDPYYGPFHVMKNGIKMTGATHSDSDFIIYDTPQESRTNRVMMSTASTITTISSPQIEYSPSVTSTDVASDTTKMTPDS